VIDARTHGEAVRIRRVGAKPTYFLADWQSSVTTKLRRFVHLDRFVEGLLKCFKRLWDSRITEVQVIQMVIGTVSRASNAVNV